MEARALTVGLAALLAALGYFAWLGGAASAQAYAKTCRSDLVRFCVTTKTGEGALYACLVENRSALTVECRSVLETAEPEMQQFGIGR